jgi:hypothetical protein
MLRCVFEGHMACSRVLQLMSEDMRQSGCTLAEILRAGQWRSAAFMAYLDAAGLDRVRILPALFAASIDCLL